MNILFKSTAYFADKAFLILVVALLSACQPRHKPSPDGKMTFKLPIADGGGISFEKYTFEWITNIINLEGPLVSFLLDPSLNKSSQIMGRDPRIKFIQGSDGVYTPSDDLSMQLLTIQRHMEALAKIDHEVGSFEMARWPRKVAVNVNYVQGQQSMVNNALYSGSLNAMLFVPYKADALPLMLNGGVIGHEHFHAIFYHQVVQPLAEKYPDGSQPSVHDEALQRKEMGLVSSQDLIDSDPAGNNSEVNVYHSVLLRGFNEGFADVWGWVLSGDVDFVRRSLPDERSFRNMDAKIESIISLENLKPFVLSASDDTKNGISYGIGNQVARAVKRLWDLQDQPTSRLQAARWVLSALPKIREAYEQKAFLNAKGEKTEAAESFISPSVFMSAVYESIEKPNVDQCHFIQQLIPIADQESVKAPDRCLELLK